MAKFEIVSKYANAELSLPTRATINSAGYDFSAAEDIIVPSYSTMLESLSNTKIYSFQSLYSNISSKENSLQKFNDMAKIYSLKEISDLTDKNKCRPTLIPTGIKCKLEANTYLELSVRSSTPLKYWIILANGIGIIDADYYNNSDNEGEIFFQVINLSPFPIQINKGEKIGQGIIKSFNIVEDDIPGGERVGGFGSTTLEEIPETTEPTEEETTESTEEVFNEITFPQINVGDVIKILNNDNISS